MTNQKIILFVNSYLPVLGGIQTVSSQLAEGFKDKGLDVHVFTNRYPINLPFREKVQGVIVKRFILGNFFNEIQNIKSLMIRLISYIIYPFTFLHLFVSIYKIKPDVINIHFPLSQLPYIKLLQKIFKFKMVTSFHGHDVLRWEEASKNSYLFQLQQSVINCSTGVTACSNFLAHKVENIFNLSKGSVKTVYNGVDLSRFESINNKIKEKEYIFAFGRLETHKGFDMLIQAFSRIKNKEIPLFIAGDGSQLEELQKQAKQLSLLDRISFLGRLSPEKIAFYLLEARAIVIPSRREPFGIVVLEAIASKKPVIASDVGGIPEILDSRFGLLVEASAAGLLNGMNKILDKQHLYSDTKVDEYLKSFSIQSMLSNYMKSYT